MTLAALPVAGEPSESDWAKAIPLDLTVWKGNIHLRPEIVTLDSETSHTSTAACHHGTANSPPVAVKLMALYSPEEIFLRAAWDDATSDGPGALGEWVRKKNGSWTARFGADDGFAIMWGSPGEKGFRCQTSCHMIDVGISGSATLMQLKMIAPSGKRYDLWRWRGGITAPFGAADDMVVDNAGKRGDEGQVLPLLNRREDGNPARTKEGGEAAPYYLTEAPHGSEADVKARGGWKDGRYSVVLRRRLVTGNPGDIAFRGTAGEIPFSIAVFDYTFREHHVNAGSFRLRLAVPAKKSKEVERDPMDF
ncbi:MAG: ethylbenzene dehydrogenase-related protein [bacterium]|jgi:hypothetical protein